MSNKEDKNKEWLKGRLKDADPEFLKKHSLKESLNSLEKEFNKLRRDLTMEQRKNRLRYKKQGKIFEEQITELKESINQLKQLIPMEWQQKENTKQIAELKNDLDNIDQWEGQEEINEELQDKITKIQSKVKLYEATIVGGDFQWLEIGKIKKALRIIADWTLLGKAPKGLDEYMIHEQILEIFDKEIFDEKEERNFKLIKTVRVTPNRGYRTVWEMSFRIPHKVLINLLGEPSTEEEGVLYTKTLEGEVHTDKTIDDLTIGHWYLDVDGEPFRIDLIDVEKLFQSKVKNYANPKREEVVYIYGNGFTAVMSFLQMVYARFGELKIGKWGKK